MTAKKAEFILPGYTLETRTCGECAHFKEVTFPPVCTKKLMAVTASLKVYFNTNEGTCWEPKGK